MSEVTDHLFWEFAQPDTHLTMEYMDQIIWDMDTITALDMRVISNTEKLLLVNIIQDL